jgi:phosphoribosyl-dephospho-CoA transferase
LRADRAAIIRHSRPLSLSAAMQHAPQTWQPGMHLLLALFERTGTVARVYGSLSSQAFTGRHYLDAASDLDLLLECGDASKLAELLAGLQNFPLPLPRIDGEVLAASGWAVAWRELASALLMDDPRQVLAKSDCETCLLPVDEFVQPFLVSA